MTLETYWSAAKSWLDFESASRYKDEFTKLTKVSCLPCTTSQQSNPSDGHGSGQRNLGTLWSLLVHRTSAGVYNDWHHWKGWTTPVHLAKENSAKLICLLVTPVTNVIPSHAAALNLLTTHLYQPQIPSSATLCNVSIGCSFPVIFMSRKNN